MKRISTPHATAGGLFQDAIPGTGQLATEFSADWCNNVQEELVTIVTASGAALDGANHGQVLAALKLLLHPVGSTYIQFSGTPTPASLFGGTWAQRATGKTLVGQLASDTDFNTLGNTGGAKLVELTAGQNGPHSHYEFATTTTGPASSANLTDTQQVSEYNQPASTYESYAMRASDDPATVGVSSISGAGDGHENMPPYEVVAFWVRTA